MYWKIRWRPSFYALKVKKIILHLGEKWKREIEKFQILEYVQNKLYHCVRNHFFRGKYVGFTRHNFLYREILAVLGESGVISARGVIKIDCVTKENDNAKV